MPRPAVLVSVLSLAVATSTTLVALGVVLTDAPADAASVGATSAHAHAFVTAVDDLLRGGEGSALEAAVAADFVDHAPSAPSARGRDGLLRDLGTLRASFTRLELTVDGVVAGGDLAAVRMAFRGTPRGDFLGVRLDPAPATWRELHVLRIAHGRVAERWSAGDAVGRFAPLGRAVLAWAPMAPTVALARFAYAPGAVVDPALPGPGLLLVETGALTVRGNGTVGIARAPSDGGTGAPEPIAPGTEATAGAGDAIVAPATPPGARNDGAVPAVALGLALFATPAGDAHTGTKAIQRDGTEAASAQALRLAMVGATTGRGILPPGVAVQPLASAAAAAVPAGPVAVGIGRAVLPPGTSLPAHRVRGLELLVVETGALRLDLGVGSAAGTSPDPQEFGAAPRPPMTAPAGGAAALQAATVATTRGTGGATLGLLVAVVAAAPAESP